MTAKTIAHVEQLAVVVESSAPRTAVAHTEQFAVVVTDDESGAVIVTAGAQGPPGKNGIDGAAVSRKDKNRLTNESDGFYVSDDLTPDPLAYYILAKT